MRACSSTIPARLFLVDDSCSTVPHRLVHDSCSSTRPLFLFHSSSSTIPAFVLLRSFLSRLLCLPVCVCACGRACVRACACACEDASDCCRFAQGAGGEAVTLAKEGLRLLYASDGLPLGDVTALQVPCRLPLPPLPLNPRPFRFLVASLFLPCLSTLNPKPFRSLVASLLLSYLSTLNPKPFRSLVASLFLSYTSLSSFFHIENETSFLAPRRLPLSLIQRTRNRETR